MTILENGVTMEKKHLTLAAFCFDMAFVSLHIQHVLDFPFLRPAGNARGDNNVAGEAGALGSSSGLQSCE